MADDVTTSAGAREDASEVAPVAGEDAIAGLATRRTDDELIEACLANDDAAWRALVARYQRLVFSIARRTGLGVEASEDILQETFVALFSSLPTLRNRTGLPKWMMTTAHRLAIRRRTRDRREVTGAEADVLSEPNADDLGRWERQHRVNVALNRLGGRCEELLRALFEGPDRPDYGHIAERLGMPVGSIGPTRARCLAKLLELLPPDLRDESQEA